VSAPRGFSLIELMVTMTILAFALMMGAPTFSSWIQNLRLRSSAESVVAGIQFAKSEAVARNSLVRFQFTSSMDSSCALSSTSAFWVVNIDPDPTTLAGHCDVAASNAPAASPFIVRKHDGAPGPAGMQVNSGGVTSITFNGLGRLNPPTAVVVSITGQNATDCAAAGGPVTCLQVTVSASGEVRMCNPKFALPDPQGC
jgi:type IV fimbrial biogenesis protein FimT